jgi:hypothetical protein
MSRNKKQKHEHHNNYDTMYKIILVTILIAAILIRFWNDPTIPFHYDPGKNIVYARAILDSFPSFPQYNSYFNLGEYYEYQVLFPYIVALLHKITGLSLVYLTSTSIIIVGSLLSVTVFLLSNEIFNNAPVALISAGLIAVSKIQLFSYMNYYPQILAMTMLPLAFVFIIRYTRTSRKKYIIYVSILSSMIILSSYLVGMVYISILTLSLIIYSITKRDSKYIYYLILIIAGTAALVAFYVLPIINRYGVKSFIDGIINTVFTQKDIPFTNAPIDILIPAAFKFVIVIILIMCISLAIYISSRKPKLEIPKLKMPKLEMSKLEMSKPANNIPFKDIKYEHILLFILTFISLILIESYRFRPILWVDRYIELLDITITIIAGYSIYFILDKIKSSKFLSPNYKLIQALVLVLIFAYPTYDIIRHGYGFGYWNTPSDLESLNWVQNNIPSDTLFATPSGITSFWVSALGGVHVLGGESSQMLGEKFDGNSYSDAIINSPNITEKMDLIRKFGVQYVYVTVRSSSRSLLWKTEYNIEGLKALNNPTYFDFVYKKEDSISGVYVIKVKENLSPKYNIPKIDKGITHLGYGISLDTIIIMIILLVRWNIIERNNKKTSKRNRT